VLLGIVAVQLLVTGIVLCRIRSVSFLRETVRFEYTRVLGLVTLFDVAILTISIVCKLIVGVECSDLIVDILFLGGLSTMSIFYFLFALSWKIKPSVTLLIKCCILIPIFGCLAWIVFLLLPFSFVSLKLVYIIIASVNIITLIVYITFVNVKNKRQPKII